MSYAPGFSAEDARILADRITAREKIEGPRIGDFVWKQGTLKVERFSHDWGDTIQSSEGGSFYLGSEGYASFSGSLNDAIPKKSLELMAHEENGSFWFFHEGLPGGNRGVPCYAKCRVYLQKEDRKE